MLELFKDWAGELDINGVHYTSINDVTSDLEQSFQQIHIVLYPKQKTSLKAAVNAVNGVSDARRVRITVKQYMTKKASPEFDFMEKWNHNNF